MPHSAGSWKDQWGKEPPEQGRHEVAGVRVCIIPAASSEGAPPWIASGRLPGGAPTQTALAGFLGALNGVHSGTQTGPLGFQKQLQVAPREERFGAAEALVRKADTRGQHAARDGTARPAGRRLSRECLRSQSQCPPR